MKRFGLVAVAIVLVAGFAGGQTTAPTSYPSLQNLPPLWELVQTSEIKGARTTIHYETSIPGDALGLVQAFEAALGSPPSTQPTRDRPDQIIARVNEILGFEPDEEQREEQRRIVEIFSGARLSPEVIYLFKESTLKDYLKRGGSVPGGSYDPVEGHAKISIDWSTKAPRPTLIVLPVPDEATLAVATPVLQKVSGNMVDEGMVLHELIELSMMRRLRVDDPYYRWFSDGVANALAAQLLGELHGAQRAQDFLKAYDVEEYADLEKDVNLVYWLGLHREIQTPLRSESRLSYARYCYATFEAKRILDTHGLDKVKLILTKASPNEQNDSRMLFTAVQDVTGEDLRARMEAKYQRFGTREEGFAMYEAAVREAEKKRDNEGMLKNMLRMREVKGDVDVGIDTSCAMLLQRMSHLKDGDKIFADLIGAARSDRARVAVQKQFIVYSLEGQRYAIARSAIRDVLSGDPYFIPALTARMMDEYSSGDKDSAVRTAELILQRDINPTSQDTAAARRIKALQPAARPTRRPSGFEL